MSGGFNLDDYVTVAERIEQFYAKFPDGSLQAQVVEMSERLVVVRAEAYRNPDDPRPGIAHSSLIIPGSTPYTKGSELENAETSAVGRAIALLGFGVKKSIASRNEIEAKGGTIAAPQSSADGSLSGIAKITDKQNSDGQLRQTPDGHTLGFRLQARAGDKGALLVEAHDPIASELAAIRDRWFNQPVTCWGRLEPRTFDKGQQKIAYQALVLSRIQTPAGVIPSEPAASEGAPTEPVTEREDGEALGAQPSTAEAGDGTSEQGSQPELAAAVCGNESPYGDGLTCDLLAHHRGNHKNVAAPFPTTWDAR